MRLFGRRRPARAPEARSPSDARRETVAYLRDFATTRVGVEAYIEPATSVTQTTVVLVATTGEWTRRKVPDAGIAREIARELGIPAYDVQLTGYPQRMREWTTKQRASLRRP